MDGYTKNELALIDFISSVNKCFYYFGEDNDSVEEHDLDNFQNAVRKFKQGLEKWHTVTTVATMTKHTRTNSQ